MVLKKASALGGTIIAVVLVVVFVPPVLLNETAEFREIFMKKCKGYPMDQTTCKNALNAFEKAFVGKNEKDVTEEDYEGLFKEVPFKHPCGITMFWTGTNELVHEFTKTRDHFFTLEDTLLGHVLNELKWCGKKNSQGIFIKECSEDKPNPVFSFWKLASAKMAQYACKIVTVMLDGEREKPYYDKSVFATVELPNLKSPKVETLMVILVVEEIGEKCNNQSLKDLSEILKAKKIGYDCKEVTQSVIKKCSTKLKRLKPCL